MGKTSRGLAVLTLGVVGVHPVAHAEDPAPFTPPQYGIVIDAGSSGSRIHVYSWHVRHETGAFNLLEDALAHTAPGVAAFAHNVSGAGTSLQPLLRHAERVVPSLRQQTTPIFLMATAGLRMLGPDQAQEVLTEVSKVLHHSPFLFRPEWAYIMAGEDEGTFGWLTVNFLLGKLGKEPAAAGEGTKAIVDLGGASVQLVHELAQDAEAYQSSRSVAEVVYAGQAYRLLRRSHEGFGLNEARRRVAQALVSSSASANGEEGHISHPCYPAGHRQAHGKESGAVTFLGIGSYGECEAQLKRLFHDKSRPWQKEGEHQIPTSVFGFSFLYDRTAGIGLLNGKPELLGMQNMTVSAIKGAAREVCELTPAAAEARFARGNDPDRWANFCGDTTYLAVLLEHGFGIEASTEITMGNKVGNFEIVWTLGAILAKARTLQQLHRLAAPPSKLAEVPSSPTDAEL